MKIVKLSILALTLGMFVTSCETKTEENTVVEGDTTMITPAPVMVEPAPVVVDSMSMNNMSTPEMEPATTTPAAPGTPAEMK